MEIKEAVTIIPESDKPEPVDIYIFLYWDTDDCTWSLPTVRDDAYSNGNDTLEAAVEDATSFANEYGFTVRVFRIVGD